MRKLKIYKMEQNNVEFLFAQVKLWVYSKMMILEK